MKKSQGGARLRAGRKKVADRAMQINVYPKTSVVKTVGGLQRAKDIALAAIVNQAEKINLEKNMKKDLVNSN